MEVSLKARKQSEPRTPEFKKQAVERMLAGEPVSRLSRQLRVRRASLYRWREAYRKGGVAGFRPVGRPRQPDQRQAPEKGNARIQELERKVGQQTLVIDFLQKAFKRVAELRRPSRSAGATASTAKCKP